MSSIGTELLKSFVTIAGFGLNLALATGASALIGPLIGVNALAAAVFVSTAGATFFAIHTTTSLLGSVALSKHPVLRQVINLSGFALGIAAGIAAATASTAASGMAVSALTGAGIWLASIAAIVAIGVIAGVALLSLCIGAILLPLVIATPFVIVGGVVYTIYKRSFG